MTIEDRRVKVAKRFGDIGVGELFADGEWIYMKLFTFVHEHSGEKNCIGMNDNRFMYFPLEKQVTPVKAKLIIE